LSKRGDLIVKSVASEMRPYRSDGRVRHSGVFDDLGGREGKVRLVSLAEKSNIPLTDRLYCYNNTTMQPLDRNGSIPLVYQLGEAIRDKIVRGEYRLGQPIPTEEQLQKSYGVSRTTVRLALAKLVNEGYIRRQQGKGTYVNPQGLVTRGKPRPLSRDMFGVKSTTQIIQSAGMKVRTDVLFFARELPGVEVATKLGISEKESVLHFERVRYADDRPLVLEKSWIPAAQCPDLKRAEVKGSLYLILFKKYHHHVAASHQILRAVLASELDAPILDLQVGQPVMLVHGVTYLEDGRPIEAQESHFRAESIEFIIELGEYSRYARLMSRDFPLCSRTPRPKDQFAGVRDGKYLS
jgi:GntR family transcriptional regulator